MGLLRKLDMFSSVNYENKSSNLVGSLVTLVSFGLLIYLTVTEYIQFRSQRLNSKVFVMNLDYHEVSFAFDIEVLKISCSNLKAGLVTPYDSFDIKKEDAGAGCRVRGEGFLRSLDNKLFLAPDGFNPYIGYVSGMPSFDFSHKIHEFQFGRTTSSLAYLAEKYPEIVVKPLANTEFRSEGSDSAHSVFYYEVNILIAKFEGVLNVLYNYSRNLVLSGGTTPFLKFNLDFSPIAIEYDERRETWLELATYLCGVVGGLLSLLKLLYNLLLSLLFRQQLKDSQPKHFEIPQ